MNESFAPPRTCFLVFLMRSRTTCLLAVAGGEKHLKKIFECKFNKFLLLTVGLLMQYWLPFLFFLDLDFRCWWNNLFLLSLMELLTGHPYGSFILCEFIFNTNPIDTQDHILIYLLIIAFPFMVFLLVMTFSSNTLRRSLSKFYFYISS